MRVWRLSPDLGAERPAVEAWAVGNGLDLRAVLADTVIVAAEDRLTVEVFVQRDGQHRVLGDGSALLKTTLTVRVVVPVPNPPFAAFQPLTADVPKERAA